MCRKTAVSNQKSGGKQRNDRMFGGASTRLLKFSKRELRSITAMDWKSCLRPSQRTLPITILIYMYSCWLLTENGSGKALIIKNAYDSLSVNSFMSDYSHYSKELRDGESSIIVSKLWESSLSYNQTTSVSDIQELSSKMAIRPLMSQYWRLYERNRLALYGFCQMAGPVFFYAQKH